MNSGRKGGQMSRRKRGGISRWLKVVILPILAVGLGIAIVMFMGTKLANTGKTTLKSTTPPKVAATTPATTGAATQGGSTTTPKPTTQPATPTPTPTTGGSTGATSPPATSTGPDAALLAARTHLDLSGGNASQIRTFYLVDGLTGGQTLVPVQVNFPTTSYILRATVDQLIKGFDDLKLYSGIPHDTNVVGVNIDGGTAIVDLKGGIEQVTGSATVQTIQSSLIYTLTQIKGVQKVELRFNGKKAVLDQVVWSGPKSTADISGGLSVSSQVIAYVK